MIYATRHGITIGGTWPPVYLCSIHSGYSLTSAQFFHFYNPPTVHESRPSGDIKVLIFMKPELPSSTPNSNRNEPKASPIVNEPSHTERGKNKGNFFAKR